MEGGGERGRGGRGRGEDGFEAWSQLKGQKKNSRRTSRADRSFSFVAVTLAHYREEQRKPAKELGEPYLGGWIRREPHTFFFRVRDT
ncbi:hypothetical protein M0802_009919 [Mischocyttarus mexicanus]|nr:hypothetical protein M0802_009919 [Mischocyttarus mexicanus]